MTTSEPSALTADDLLTRQREIFAQALARVGGSISAVALAEKALRTVKSDAKLATDRASYEVASCLVQRDAAIATAYELGIPAADVGKAANVSASTVSQIAARARKAVEEASVATLANGEGKVPAPAPTPS